MHLCRGMVLSHFMYNICGNKMLNSAVGRVVYRMLIFSVPTQHAVFQSTAGYWWRVQKEVSRFYWWRRQNCIKGWLDKNESKSHCVHVCWCTLQILLSKHIQQLRSHNDIKMCYNWNMNILFYIYICAVRMIVVVIVVILFHPFVFILKVSVFSSCAWKGIKCICYRLLALRKNGKSSVF